MQNFTLQAAKHEKYAVKLKSTFEDILSVLLKKSVFNYLRVLAKRLFVNKQKTFLLLV